MPNNEIKEILTKLVSFKTTSDNPEEIRRGFKYIESLFSGLPIEIKNFEKNGKRSQVIFFKGSNWQKPKVLLNGHLDVVPAVDDSEFVLKEGDGKIYGRGTADMKGGIVAFIAAMRELARLEKKPDAALLITSDEETGGEDGVGYLVKDVGLKPAFALSADGPRRDRFTITIKEKGVVWLEIKAHGKSAHGARPWLGENAVDKIIDAIRKIQDFMGKVEPEAWKSTYNLSFIETGNKTSNVVPDSARAVMDIRFTEAFVSHQDELVEKIKKIVPDVEVSTITTACFLDTLSDNLFVRELQRTAEKVCGNEVPLGFGHGASDSRYFAEKGIPAALIGPVGANWHSENEWVHAESLDFLKDTAVEFLKRF